MINSPKKKDTTIPLSNTSKWQIKLILVVGAFIIVISAIFFTKFLVDELIEREKSIVKSYAEIYKQSFDPNANIEEYLFFLEKIAPTIAFPLIITDDKDVPVKDYKDNSLNVNLDTTKDESFQLDYLKKYVSEMGRNYNPVIVEDKEGRVINKIYYNHSSLVKKLQWFPYVEILIVAIFILVSYVAFTNIRRSEESKVWVGMAKEAAHQLGTPLSSLLAWVEIMKYQKDDMNALLETIDEMENDINRLNIIARRFSKIGSMPDKAYVNITDVLDHVCVYFEKRLPHLGKRIQIRKSFEDDIYGEVNVDLFEWVIENLLKNAAEAIDNKSGIVSVTLESHLKKRIVINITDNGKGMSSKQRRSAFNPGYTTKKRGWGLGLSLSKRIIEGYHEGKIFIKESTPLKGTTFQIEIPQLDKN